MSGSQDNNIFDHIEQKSNIKANDIFKVADSVKDGDFTDESTVRNLVKQLASMANKPIPKEKEDQIVNAITNQNIPLDMNTLNQMFKK